LSGLDDVLGQARSADVTFEKLEQTAQQLDAAKRPLADEVLRIFRERRPAARERLRAALSEGAHRQLLDALVEAVREPRCSRRASEPANDWTSQLMERVWRKARKRVRNAQTPPSDRDLHRIRIASKHLRYASEAFETTQGKAATRYAKRAERLQITLGDQHDAVEAHAQLRSIDLAAEARSVALELAAQLDKQARTLRRKWGPLWNALREHRFWD
jgi:CHAD domain-containing protein